jgi:hypothetical protein
MLMRLAVLSSCVARAPQDSGFVTCYVGFGEAKLRISGPDGGNPASDF